MPPYLSGHSSSSCSEVNVRSYARWAHEKDLFRREQDSERGSHFVFFRHSSSLTLQLLESVLAARGMDSSQFVARALGSDAVLDWDKSMEEIRYHPDIDLDPTMSLKSKDARYIRVFMPDTMTKMIWEPGMTVGKLLENVFDKYPHLMYLSFFFRFFCVISLFSGEDYRPGDMDGNTLEFSQVLADNSIIELHAAITYGSSYSLPLSPSPLSLSPLSLPSYPHLYLGIRADELEGYSGPVVAPAPPIKVHQSFSPSYPQPTRHLQFFSLKAPSRKILLKTISF